MLLGCKVIQKKNPIQNFSLKKNLISPVFKWTKSSVIARRLGNALKGSAKVRRMSLLHDADSNFTPLKEENESSSGKSGG